MHYPYDRLSCYLLYSKIYKTIVLLIKLKKNQHKVNTATHMQSPMQKLHRLINEFLNPLLRKYIIVRFHE